MSKHMPYTSWMMWNWTLLESCAVLVLVWTSFLRQNWINWSGKTKHNTPLKCPWKGTSFPSKHFLCGYSDSFDKTNSARHCTFRSRGLSAIQESEKVWKSDCHLQIKYLAATIARSWGKSRWHLFITLWPQPISTSVRQQSITCCSLTDANYPDWSSSWTPSIVWTSFKTIFGPSWLHFSTAGK